MNQVVHPGPRGVPGVDPTCRVLPLHGAEPFQRWLGRLELEGGLSIPLPRLRWTPVADSCALEFFRRGWFVSEAGGLEHGMRIGVGLGFDKRLIMMMIPMSSVTFTWYTLQ